MVDPLPWQLVSELKLGSLADFAEDMATTKGEIADHIESFDAVNEQLESNAFGGCADNGLYSPGAETAMAVGVDLADRLTAAKAEAAGIYDTVDWAHGELKRLKGKFNDKVDEINGTGSGTKENPGGNFEVDLANELVKTPSVPAIYKHQFEIQEWNDNYQGKADEFSLELDDIAMEAAEVDSDAATWLANNSSNKDEFNGKPDGDMPSVQDAEDDAAETSDLLSGGEDGIVSDEELDKANELMAEHEGDPVFATTLLEDMGAKGLLTDTGQIAFSTDENGENRDPDDVKAMYDNLGKTLATGTDPDNEPHVSDEWMKELMEQGGQPLTIPDPSQPNTSAGWQQYGYQALAPMLKSGKYDESFIVPVTEHMMTLSDQGVSWHLSDIPPILADDEKYINNPINAGLLAVDHNPEAATVLFTEDNEYGKNGYPGPDGETVDAVDPLTFVFDEASDTMDGTWSGVDADLAGNAIEAACTGLSSDTEFDPGERPEHTKEMTGVTQRVFDHVTANPADFQGEGLKAGMVDNLGDITANYMEDFYRAYSDDAVLGDKWMPDSHGVPLDLDGEGGFAETSKTDEWMQVLGHNEEAMTTVTAAGSGLATHTFGRAAFDDDVAARSGNMYSALDPFSRMNGAMTEGRLEAIQDDELDKADKSFKDNAVTGAKKLAAWGASKIPAPGLDKLAGTLADKFITWVSGKSDEQLAADILDGQKGAVEDGAGAISSSLDMEQLEQSLKDAGIDDIEGAKAKLLERLDDEYYDSIDVPKSFK